MKMFKIGLIASTLLFNAVCLANPQSTETVDVHKELESQLKLNLDQVQLATTKFEVEPLIKHLDQQVNHQVLIAEADFVFPAKQYKVEFSE